MKPRVAPSGNHSAAHRDVARGVATTAPRTGPTPERGRVAMSRESAGWLAARVSKTERSRQGAFGFRYLGRINAFVRFGVSFADES
jgi:hypothetical protein